MEQSDILCDTETYIAEILKKISNITSIPRWITFFDDFNEDVILMFPVKSMNRDLRLFFAELRDEFKSAKFNIKEVRYSERGEFYQIQPTSLIIRIGKQ